MTTAWCVVLLAVRFGAAGFVVDGWSGQSLVGARVLAGDQQAVSGADGVFQLRQVGLWQSISFSLDGYETSSLGPWGGAWSRVELRPLTAEVSVVDRSTGLPVDADLRVQSGRTERLGSGNFRLLAVRLGDQVEASAEGYRPVSTAWNGAELELRLARLPHGRLLDAATGQPVAGALVAVDGQVVASDGAGAITLPGEPRQPPIAFRSGYRRAVVALGSGDEPFEVRLEPFVARGVYLSLYAAGDPQLRDNISALLETTELNTLVVDLKGDRGTLLHPSGVPLAHRLGADAQPSVPDARAWLARLRQRGVYLIARIVLFKDDVLARRGPSVGLDLAVRDEATGQPWIDGEGLGWVDPFRPEVWEYNLALAREAASLGFDEVQFDYVRFPTDASGDTSVGAAVYSRESTAASRVAALTGFLQRARQALRPFGLLVSIDTFGYTCWRDDDLGIGQVLAALAPDVDYLSPMIYPSTFKAGLPGDLAFPSVVSRPYDVVRKSLGQAQVRASGTPLRPWIQHFDDYAWQTGRAYNEPEIQAQKRAADDANAAGWLLWDPTNRYARGGLAPR